VEPWNRGSGFFQVGLQIAVCPNPTGASTMQFSTRPICEPPRRNCGGLRPVHPWVAYRNPDKSSQVYATWGRAGALVVGHTEKPEISAPEKAH
jgi:hypothetical protein